jgi:hypothetical protein
MNLDAQVLRALCKLCKSRDVFYSPPPPSTAVALRSTGCQVTAASGGGGGGENPEQETG